MTSEQIATLLPDMRNTLRPPTHLLQYYYRIPSVRSEGNFRVVDTDVLTMREVPFTSERYLAFRRGDFMPERLPPKPRRGSTDNPGESILVPGVDRDTGLFQRCVMMQINQSFDVDTAARACMTLLAASMAHLGTRVFDMWYSAHRKAVCVVVENVRPATLEELNDKSFAVGMHLLIQHSRMIGLTNPAAQVGQIALTAGGRIVYTAWPNPVCLYHW